MKVSLISSKKLNGFSMTFLSEGETSTPGWSSLPEVRGAWPNKKGFEILKNFLYVQIFCAVYCCVVDPDPLDLAAPGSGSGSILVTRIRIQEQGILPKFTNKPEFQPFNEAIYLRTVGTAYFFLSLLPKKYIFM
jgi:hypothetical protein